MTCKGKFFSEALSTFGQVTASLDTPLDWGSKECRLWSLRSPCKQDTSHIDKFFTCGWRTQRKHFVRSGHGSNMKKHGKTCTTYIFAWDILTPCWEYKKMEWERINAWILFGPCTVSKAMSLTCKSDMRFKDPNTPKHEINLNQSLAPYTKFATVYTQYLRILACVELRTLAMPKSPIFKLPRTEKQVPVRKNGRLQTEQT